MTATGVNAILIRPHNPELYLTNQQEIMSPNGAGKKSSFQNE
jgi:hypothetical protein